MTAAGAGVCQVAAAGAGVCQVAIAGAGAGPVAASGAGEGQVAAAGAGVCQVAAAAVGVCQAVVAGAGVWQVAVSGEGVCQVAVASAGRCTSGGCCRCCMACVCHYQRHDIACWHTDPLVSGIHCTAQFMMTMLCCLGDQATIYVDNKFPGRAVPATLCTASELKCRLSYRQYMLPLDNIYII